MCLLLLGAEGDAPLDSLTPAQGDREWCADPQRLQWLLPCAGEPQRRVRVFFEDKFVSKYQHTLCWFCGGGWGEGQRHFERVAQPQDADVVFAFSAYMLRPQQLRGVRCVYATFRGELGKQRLPELLDQEEHFQTYVGAVPPGTRLQGWWVEKELGKSCGSGIRMLYAGDGYGHVPAGQEESSPEEVDEEFRGGDGEGGHPWHKSGFVLQKYLENPLLIEGFKFDVRVLVCVRNDGWAMVYPDGVMKFASQPFSLQHGSPDSHLTNLMRNHSSPAPLPQLLSQHRWFDTVMSQITRLSSKLLVRCEKMGVPPSSPRSLCGSVSWGGNSTYTHTHRHTHMQSQLKCVCIRTHPQTAGGEEAGWITLTRTHVDPARLYHHHHPPSSQVPQRTTDDQRRGRKWRWGRGK